jgi:hypothetical protein
MRRHVLEVDRDVAADARAHLSACRLGHQRGAQPEGPDRVRFLHSRGPTGGETTPAIENENASRNPTIAKMGAEIVDTCCENEPPTPIALI